MNWIQEPAAERLPSRLRRIGRSAGHPLRQGDRLHLVTAFEAHPENQTAFASPDAGPAVPPKDYLKVGKTFLMLEENGKQREVEIFTLTMGAETMNLLPLRNWGQLDVHKWRVQGKLPGTPAGLEITFDHVKIAGETVNAKDPDACAKLEKAFNEWLELEKATLAAARMKAQAKSSPKTQEVARSSEPQAPHFRVEVESGGQVHVKCVQGKETVTTIGLNVPGFNSLCSQGLMRKPRMLKVGALHDWVELDGVLYSFEKGHNDAAKLEKTLNEAYLPSTTLGHGKDVVVLENGASATGFDLQFPVMVGGVPDSRKRHMNDESLEALQDQERCGLLHKGIVIKLSPPNLIFKRKTPDGGERYLEKTPENLVVVVTDDGGERVIDLSHPVNYLKLTAVDLTAVFNHPAIHKHGKAVTRASVADEGQRSVGAPVVSTPEPVAAPPPVPIVHPPEPVVAETKGPSPEAAKAVVVEAPSETGLKLATAAVVEPPRELKRSPNSWLKEVLAVTGIRHEWFTCLVYAKMAQWLGNSCEGRLGLSHCWAISLGDSEDPADPKFEGIFLTEKGGFGYTCRERMARFNKGVAFLGTLESGIEGIGINLVGAGIDVEKRMVFIVSDNYRTKFGVPDQAVEKELAQLRDCGVLVMSVSEALVSLEELEVVWTVPAEQQDPANPQVSESKKPASA